MRGFAVVGVGGSDAVVEHPAIVLQQPADLGEIGLQVVQPHVFEHANAGDAVELPFHVSVILQADLDPVLQARGFHALGGQVELVLGQCHAHAIRAIVLRGADHQGAPAAADVQQAVPRPHLDLGQDVVDLLELRGFQAFIAILEIGAGVDHARVQPALVEGVGHVVVVLDGFPVALLRVLELPHDARQPPLGLAAGFGHLVPQRQDVGDAAFDVEQPLDIGFPQAVQAGAEQVGDRAGFAQADGHQGAVEVTELEATACAVLVAKLHQDRQVDLFLELRHPGGQRGFHLAGCNHHYNSPRTRVLLQDWDRGTL